MSRESFGATSAARSSFPRRDRYHGHAVADRMLPCAIHDGPRKARLEAEGTMHPRLNRLFGSIALAGCGAALASSSALAATPDDAAAVFASSLIATVGPDVLAHMTGNAGINIASGSGNRQGNALVVSQAVTPGAGQRRHRRLDEPNPARGLDGRVGRRRLRCGNRAAARGCRIARRGCAGGKRRQHRHQHRRGLSQHPAEHPDFALRLSAIALARGAIYRP